MKKLLCALLLFVFLGGVSFGASGVGLMIDNFEDGNIAKDPEWWVFDNLNLKPSANTAKDAFSVEFSGKASDWYVGGMGAYLAKDEYDFSSFNSLELSVYGYGPKSGTLKVELYEDDNGNWQIEQDPKKNYSPVFDDRFSYELRINWSGWKEVRIPLSDFVDTNPRAGDNVWNPQKLGKSGGLVQMQLIVLAASKNGSAHFIMDNLRFTSK